MSVQYTGFSTPREDLGMALHEFDPSSQGLIATQVLPIRAVRKQAANFSMISRENKKNAERVKRAAGSAFARVHMRAEDLAYACELYGLEAPLADEDRDNYEDDFNAEMELTQLINLLLLLDLEIEVAALVFNTATWTGGGLYVDHNAAPWDAAATDIIAQAEEAKEYVRQNCGQPANALVISAKTLSNMRLNTGIKGAFPGIATLTYSALIGNLPGILGIERILVGGQVYDTADDGQASTMADIWPDDYAMFARLNSSADSLWAPGLGRTMAWRSVSSDLVATDQYREEQTKSDIFRVEHALDPLILNKYCGFLIKIDA